MDPNGLSNEPYTLEILPQPAALSVYSFKGQEELSQPYRFEVVFTSTTADIAMASVLGHPARHFPLIDGTEVALAFTCGDPDRPIIIGSLHDSEHGDHVTNLNNTRNILRTAAGNELRMEDRRGIEHVHLTTPYQTSELNLGEMPAPKRGEPPRGAGAELRTDGHAAVRAQKGVLISAHGQPKAAGPQLDMAHPQGYLQAALAQIEALSTAATTALALKADLESHIASLKDKLTGLQAAGLVMSAPDGVALTSGDSLHMAAAKSVAVTAAKQVDLTSSGVIHAQAGQGLSLFSQAAGLNAIAAAGDVRVEAHSGATQVAARGDVRIQSAGGIVRIDAPKEIHLTTGATYLRLTPNGFEVGTSGDIIAKCVIFDVEGPNTIAPLIAALPVGAVGPTDLAFYNIYADGSPIASRPYKATLPDGSVRSGTLDANGFAQISGVTKPGMAQVTYGSDPNPDKGLMTIGVDVEFARILASL
jgi:type VI secretion system secreted protein VgrG